MDPAHRTILQVTIEEAIEADKIFNMLHGRRSCPPQTLHRKPRQKRPR